MDTNSDKTPKVLSAPQAGIFTHQISKGAAYVIDQLNTQGFEAYVVGGSIRDLLSGQTPKDFDIVTNARPEEIKQVFKHRCLLIGRRFRLAHIRYQREVIEVATFRAHHSELDGPATNDKGLVLNDNVYGTLEEDAKRRDFTVNALYYDPIRERLLDYGNGLADLKQKQLTLIGTPEDRYREDPVRMLRAVRLACKLNFTIEANAASAITEHGHLLTYVPAARMFDEILKLFLQGHAKTTFDKLIETDLLKYFFPQTWSVWSDDSCIKRFLDQAVINTDTRILSGKTVNPAFLFAAFLWFPLLQEHKKLMKKKIHFFPALHKAMRTVIFKQTQSTAIPKRFSHPMGEIWELQFRLSNLNGKRAFKLLENPRFRAAYDFLLLREETGECPPGLGDWWTEFQEASPERQAAMVRTGQKRSRRQ